jgi:GNAT superfamily N-acetyltransferase
VNAQATKRAIDFLDTFDEAAAEEVLAAPGGRAIRDSRHRALWSANHLRVEAVEAPPVADLHAAALRHFGDLDFQLIAVRDPAVACALAEPLAVLGYRAAHERLMILEADVDRPDPRVEVAEVALELIRPTRVAAQVEAGRSADVGRQLAARDVLIADVVNQRCFAVLVDGEVAARCQLYGVRPVAQIENVYTAPARRGHGLARALLARAALEARAAGAETVFLVADAADWPQTFYRRAGFRDARILHRFLRTDRP